MGGHASQYERELRALLEGEPETVRRYARRVPPKYRAVLERLQREPFLVIRAAGSHGFDLIALRRGFAFPIEVKASGQPAIRFSSASGRNNAQLREHLEAARRGGLVVLYAYRHVGDRDQESWRVYRPPSTNGHRGRISVLQKHLPEIGQTRDGNGVLRWEHGKPLSEFLDVVLTLFGPEPGA